jgi:hypothetical protein
MKRFPGYRSAGITGEIAASSREKRPLLLAMTHFEDSESLHRMSFPKKHRDDVRGGR